MKKSTTKKVSTPILSEKPAAPRYHISIRIGDKTYEGQGNTAFEALSSIETPAKIMAKAVLSITNGTKTAQRMYMPVQAKRLFFKIAQPFQAKNLEFMLK